MHRLGHFKSEWWLTVPAHVGEIRAAGQAVQLLNMHQRQHERHSCQAADTKIFYNKPPTSQNMYAKKWSRHSVSHYVDLILGRQLPVDHGFGGRFGALVAPWWRG